MKHLRVSCWVLLFGTLLKAQLTVPQLGLAHFSDGSIHVVRGVAANLIVDARTVATVDRTSFSNAGGLTSSKGLIRLLRTNGSLIDEYRSGEPLPLLNIESTLKSAAVWLPSKHLLLGWDGSAFTETLIDDSSLAGLVTFVKLAGPTAAQFFVVRPDSSVARLSFALPSGRFISSDTQPGVYGRVFVHRTWILAQDARGLVAASPQNQRQEIPLSQIPLPSGDLTIEQMSDDWLHVSSLSTGANWAVFLSPSKTTVSLIPPPIRTAAQ